MEDNALSQIRTIYSELQGYLLVAPEAGDSILTSVIDAPIRDQFNNTLRKLNSITGDRYSHFEIVPSLNSKYTTVALYRTNLAGLIFSIHADFFYDKPQPITKTNSGQLIFNQSIQQTQNVTINILKELIDNKMRDYEEDSKQKNFLEKLSNYITTTNNISDIIRKIISLAKSLGLSLDEIAGIFS